VSHHLTLLRNPRPQPSLSSRFHPLLPLPTPSSQTHPTVFRRRFEATVPPGLFPGDIFAAQPPTLPAQVAEDMGSIERIKFSKAAKAKLLTFCDKYGAFIDAEALYSAATAERGAPKYAKKVSAQRTPAPQSTAHLTLTLPPVRSPCSRRSSTASWRRGPSAPAGS
jgi:hypothetical protein